MARSSAEKRALVESLRDHIAMGQSFTAWAVVQRVEDESGETACRFVAAFSTKVSAQNNAEPGEVVVQMDCRPVAVCR